MDVWKLEIFYEIVENIKSSLTLSQNYIVVMGRLQELGDTLSPQQAAQHQQKMKLIGIRQFLKMFQKHKNWQKMSDPMTIKWGEEIEGHFLRFNEKNQLEFCLTPLSQEYKEIPFQLVIQFGKWMFEMIPFFPYETKDDFQEIIKAIRFKYQVMHSKPRLALTIPLIPFLGLRNPNEEEQFINVITESIYISDKHISDFSKYKELVKNAKLRMGKQVQTFIPIYKDKYTSLEELSQTEPNPEFIYLDSMVFGAGSSCLQCTFSSKNFDHARYLYDQLHIISPLMLALTAASPFIKGKIKNGDIRWKMIAETSDCRNQNERDPHHPKFLSNTRYCPAGVYISNKEFNKPQYNNLILNQSPQVKEYIKSAAEQLKIDIDDILVKHLANLFKRDILVFNKKLLNSTENQDSLFDIMNATNWNSVRLKLPIDEENGWRVQFRTMEVSPTPDENSAFILFVHFFVRILHIHENINLYMPMSLVEKNFDIAETNDAIKKERFYFRTNILDKGEPIIKLLTMDEIFFGSQSNPQYPGLFPLIKKVLITEECPRQSSIKVIEQVQEFIKSITSKKRNTVAQWMRLYVNRHPEYKHNSILPKKVIDDLLLTLDQISKGKLKDENFAPIFH